MKANNMQNMLTPIWVYILITTVLVICTVIYFLTEIICLAIGVLILFPVEVVVWISDIRKQKVLFAFGVTPFYHPYKSLYSRGWPK